MSLLTKTLNYSLTSGNTSLDSQQIDGENVIVQLSMSAIPDTNTVLSLEQSVDGVTYQKITDTDVTLAAAQTVQTWNVRGMVRGAFLRVKVVTTSSAGVLGTMKVLTSTY